MSKANEIKFYLEKKMLFKFTSRALAEEPQLLLIAGVSLNEQKANAQVFEKRK